VARYFAAIGGFGGGDVNTGFVFVSMTPKNKRKPDPATGRVLTQQELAQVFREQFAKMKDIKAFVQDPSLGGFGGGRNYPIDFSIRGPDWDKLAELTKTMMSEMTKTGLMVDVDTNYRSGMPEIQVIPDRDRAKARGVSLLEINKAINAMIGGAVAGKYTREGHRYDIRVRLIPEDRNKSTDITKLNVRNNRGELVPLASLVKLTQKPSLQSISRENRERAIGVYANVKPGASQSDALEKVAQIGKAILPSGYYIAESGSTQTYTESFQSLVAALVLGLIISYMVLASQFNSYADPVTVLMALPFSVSGAFIFLWLGNQSINIYSMIGLILLMGIVKKNSIMLVDFTNQVRDTGKGIHDSLIEACPIRLRPILMTSFATIAGAVPAALAFGPGAETRVPMALGVIGGVLVSTFLTLFVVPCVYSLISAKNRRPHQAL
jgi:HAE1 family hydrophobic/amphiphilic exporter-1